MCEEKKKTKNVEWQQKSSNFVPLELMHVIKRQQSKLPGRHPILDKVFTDKKLGVFF